MKKQTLSTLLVKTGWDRRLGGRRGWERQLSTLQVVTLRRGHLTGSQGTRQETRVTTHFFWLGSRDSGTFSAILASDCGWGVWFAVCPLSWTVSSQGAGGLSLLPAAHCWGFKGVTPTDTQLYACSTAEVDNGIQAKLLKLYLLPWRLVLDTYFFP